MKIKSLTVSALLLVAGLSSAQAATLNYAVGDLFVGFRATGDNDNLTVNLGNASTFKTGTGLVDLSSRVTVADLSDAYGSSWNTLGDALKFGAFASNSRAVTTAGEVKQTIWMSAERENVASQSNAIGRQSGTAQGGYAINMEQVYTKNSTNPMGFKNNLSTGNSDFAFIADGTQQGSYNQEATTSNYFVAPTVVGIAEQEAVASVGSAWSLLDLYLLNPGTAGSPGTYLGTFGLALSDTTANGTAFNAGSFVYQFGGADAFAIPEPSTYALILGAMTVGFVGIRRRFSKAV